MRTPIRDKKLRSIPLLAGFLLGLGNACPALATESGGNSSGNKYGLFESARKKQDSKQNTRWTLEEWLAQRDRNRLMDMWLAMNAPEPYEYFLAGVYDSYAFNPDTNAAVPVSSHYNAYRGAFAAYAYIVGLEIQYENNAAEHFRDTTGIFHLRILGNAAQSTNITLEGGLRSRYIEASEITLRQTFVGASLSFYILKKFGIEGLYHSYLPYTDAALGSIAGRRLEGGVFVDFESIRVFGDWYTESQDSTLNNLTTTTDRTGIQSGLKIFF
jgi:hypothetical protein